MNFKAWSLNLGAVIWKLICGRVKLGYFDMSMIRIFQEPLNNLEVVVLKALVFFVKSKFVLLAHNKERERDSQKLVGGIVWGLQESRSDYLSSRFLLMVKSGNFEFWLSHT